MVIVKLLRKFQLIFIVILFVTSPDATDIVLNPSTQTLHSLVSCIMKTSRLFFFPLLSDSLISALPVNTEETLHNQFISLLLKPTKSSLFLLSQRIFA